MELTTQTFVDERYVRLRNVLRATQLLVETTTPKNNTGAPTLAAVRTQMDMLQEDLEFLWVLAALAIEQSDGKVLDEARKAWGDGGKLLKTVSPQVEISATQNKN